MGIQRDLTPLDHLPRGGEHPLQPSSALRLGLGGQDKQARQGLGRKPLAQPREMHTAVLPLQTVCPRLGLRIHTPVVLPTDIVQRGAPMGCQMLAPEGALKQKLEKILNL